MTLNDLLAQIKSNPETVEFAEVIAVINDNYDYTPTSFSNAALLNGAGQNEGSCKIFAFAELNELSKEATLACFGHYYRDDVLGNPTGDDHENIRNFMQSGWGGIQFVEPALIAK